MERVEVTRSLIGLVYMQVCAESGVSKDDIEAEANRLNPSGTRNGWSLVGEDVDKEKRPVSCGYFDGRIHYLLSC